MPWTPERYPPAMRRLPLEVRLKAIDIANAMLDEGYEEGQAIRMAIAAAKKWAWGAGSHGLAERHDTDASPRRAAVSANGGKGARDTKW